MARKLSWGGGGTDLGNSLSIKRTTMKSPVLIMPLRMRVLKQPIEKGNFRLKRKSTPAENKESFESKVLKQKQHCCCHVVLS